MQNQLILLLCLLGICRTSFSQIVNEAPKRLKAKRIETAPKIDGILNENIWENVDIATNFIQQSPVPGNPAEHDAEIKIVYDNTAVYLGARIHAPSKDSIARALTERDSGGNTDFLAFIIDPYQDGNNAFEFSITAAGVQYDARASNNGGDNNWDAVWHSAVTVDDTGWTVEYKIPFSALRFPDKPIQEWNVNFLVSRFFSGERIWWNELKPEIQGWLNQAGIVEGIENVKPPVRLFFSPFVSFNVDHFPYNTDGVKNTKPSFNAGMDIKYGINEAFTLDMTLVPDFGQVQSDNQILNLSPFEVQFAERRQFFTEGTELFSKGNLFYSRRIGGTPSGFYDVYGDVQEGETILKNPSEVQLFNSTKISGRTNGGLGIGVLNSVTGEMTAEIEDVNGEVRTIKTEPLTNYNVFVLDQNLKNNSYVSFINTNVWREGEAYEANVTGSEFNIRNKKNSYMVSGLAALSQKYFTNLSNPELGYQTSLAIRKTSGQFQFSFENQIRNHTYDHNDLGFLRINNSIDFEGFLRYNIYKPKNERFLGSYNGLRIENSYRYHNPTTFQNLAFILFSENSYRNFWRSEFWTVLEPILTYDFFEPRREGRFYEFPTNYNFGGNFNTDNRKKWIANVSANYRHWPKTPQKRANIRGGLSYQFTEKFRMEGGVGAFNFFNDIGYAGVDGNDDIIFGQRDQFTVENVVRVLYTFNNRMGLNLRARHYWSKAIYEDYFLLDEDGRLANTSYTGIDEEGNSMHNVNFNVFNIDLIYQWQFAPGSLLSFGWKNAIFSSDRNIEDGYFRNIGRTFQNDQNNLFTFRVIYFLDFLSLKKKKGLD